MSHWSHAANSQLALDQILLWLSEDQLVTDCKENNNVMVNRHEVSTVGLAGVSKYQE